MHTERTAKLSRASRRWWSLGFVLGLALLLLGVQRALTARHPWAPAAAGSGGWGAATRLDTARGPKAVPPGVWASASTSATAWQRYPLFGGEMTSIAVSELHTGTQGLVETVYVGTRDAGVFKSVDGGQTWAPARTGLTFFPIRTLVTDPHDPDVLYAGTDYAGVWKSTDGAATWSLASRGLDPSLIVFSLVVDPQDPNTLYAGLGGGVGLTIGNLYKSEDGGVTWTLRDAGMPRASGTSTHTNAIFTLVIDPEDPQQLYAGTNFEGAFVTLDGGATWSAMNDGLPFLPNSTEYRVPVSALALDPHRDRRPGAIAGMDYYVFEAGSWRQVNQGTGHVNTGVGRAFLYVHPTLSNTLYSAGDRFSKSTDGGETWTRYLGWSDSGHVREIAFHRQTPDTLYAATDLLMRYWGGVYRSYDQGETWTEASQGITALPIQAVAVDPQDRDRIYLGGGSGHLWRTEDGGSTWSRTYLEASGVSDIAVNPQDPRKVYLAARDFFTSTDRGATFREVDALANTRCIAVAADGSAVYVGGGLGYGVYRSHDGVTWSQITATLPVFGSSTCPVLSLAVDPHDPDTVWAGMQYGGGIARSSDGGEHWQVMALTETNFVEAIALHPQDSAVMLAGAGFWTGGIYKSTDGGHTWQQKLADIAFVQDIVYDPRNPRWVYAATEGYGVLRSFDGGETWHDYSAGIFYPVLYSLDVIPGEPPLLVAGSYASGGYWRRPAPPLAVYVPLLLR